MDALAPFLQPIELRLDQLYLDPNNPRFVGSEWQYVPDAVATSAPAQADVAKRLMGHYDVKKLQLGIEANGFLPIDRVVVRRIDTDKYLVIEGNRRICAAKAINGYSDDGNVLSPAIMHTLKEIACLEYVGKEDDQDIAWIVQGLRHISGIVDWPAFNKAKLLVDEMERSELTFTDVGKRFGLSAFGAAQWVRGYYAYRQAKAETEYGSYLDERIYPYFQEIFGRSSIAIKEWLNWDDSKKTFLNQANLNEFVGWFFPPSSEDEEADTGPTRELTEGDLTEAWGRRRITKRDDLRRLSYLITKAPRDWLDFRSGGDLEKAYSRAVLGEVEKDLEEDANIVDRLYRHLDETNRLLENTPFLVLANEESRSFLFSKAQLICVTLDRLKGMVDKAR